MIPNLPNTAQSGAVRAFDNRRPESVFRGLPSGSQILTQAGTLPVEYLTEGDRLITRDFGLATVTGIRHGHTQGCAVHVRKGVLGHARPEKDLLLPCDQMILLRDWRATALFGCAEVMVPIKRLVDGEFITLEADQRMTLFHIELSVGHIIYADGLETILGDPN